MVYMLSKTKKEDIFRPLAEKSHAYIVGPAIIDEQIRWS